MNGTISNARMAGRAAMVVSLLAVFSIVGCAGKTDDKTPDLTPEEAEQVTRTMVDWLECEECLNGELDRVVEVGAHLRPLLISTLQNGPSTASRALLRIELEKRYDEIQAYARTHPHAKVDMAKADFVDLYLGNFEAQYQTRAATALGAIGGARSKSALREALDKIAREDVKSEIRQALAKIQ